MLTADLPADNFLRQGFITAAAIFGIILPI